MGAERMGLRPKLGLYVVGFGGFLLAVLGVTTLRSEATLSRGDAEARGVALLRALAIPCGIALANNEISALDNYVVQFADAAQSLDLAYLAVLDYSSRVVAHTDGREYGKLYEDPFTRRAATAAEPVTRIGEHHGRELLEVAVPLVSGLRWGTIRAGFTLESTARALARSRARLLWTGLVVLVGATAVAYALLSSMVIRPLVRMSDMARRFGAGERGARVDIAKRDEIGELAERLNDMAHQLQSHTEGLERLVAERTRELSQANDKLLDANRQLELLARTDALTGLFNRRQLTEQLQLEIRRGARTPHQFSLLMVDVDHFKRYNDANGHTAGDELLQRLASLLQSSLRSTDLVARYGGEEFVILLLDTGPEEGHATARELQRRVESAPLPRGGSQPGGRVTISIGVSFYPEDATDGRTLIDYADQALYRSKQQGRNRVSCWREPAAAAS